MAPEASNVAKPIGLETMNRGEIVLKACLKFSDPKPVELRKPFSQKPKELGVGFFLAAAFHDHAWKLRFLPGR